ncbi:sensor histidine kinase [Nonomuraea basaltis]|uniref:sensor histidine kinase n=1 Tax=Nonomuraea basaltis TaxID=2495887 RepID=UPI00110C592F|nr:histidine kinase [Nonomuraea basaltis]TMR95063.1 histidine kinase [Nonomuraea basaltis]
MPSTVTARPLFRSTQALLDTALTAGVFAVSLALLSHGGPTPLRAGSQGLDALGVVLAACSAVPFLAWRRFPLAVFAVTAGAGVLLAGLGYPVDLLLGPIAALYLLAASREQETPWTVRSAAVVAGMFVAYLGAAAYAQEAFPGVGMIHTGLPWAVAWFAGERTRLRREQMAELRRRAQHAEREAERKRLRAVREAERERLLAVAEERARIARDLHDSAGHAISLIAIRAGAARLRHHEDGDRTVQALQAVEDLARHTVAEIDHIVGTLRDDGALRDGDPEVAAPLGLASLDTLIAHHTAAGLRVQLDVTGTPRPLGTAADQAAYRILQQALTNAARHGTGNAQIDLGFTETEVKLTVTNPVRTGGTPRRSGGHGLIGMRERATLLGGSFEAVHVDGVFRVHARIPDGGHRA